MSQTPPPAWRLQPISTGHQPILETTLAAANLSCGFWASIYAILSILGSPIKQSMNLAMVKASLSALLVDYRTNALGGLSQDVTVACVEDFVPNIQARFAHIEHLAVWAPKVPEG
ncbi:hypothetical protein FRC06_003746 [Ceratobasidium sp. 370]|nr:hypothetical protein FRC06_003746 [Ceratobasidium sp. 370]